MREVGFVLYGAADGLYIAAERIHVVTTLSNGYDLIFLPAHSCDVYWEIRIS